MIFVYVIISCFTSIFVKSAITYTIRIKRFLPTDVILITRIYGERFVHKIQKFIHTNYRNECEDSKIYYFFTKMNKL